MKKKSERERADHGRKKNKAPHLSAFTPSRPFFVCPSPFEGQTSFFFFPLCFLATSLPEVSERGAFSLLFQRVASGNRARIWRERRIAPSLSKSRPTTTTTMLPSSLLSDASRRL